MIRIVADATAEIESARHYLNRHSRLLGHRFLEDLEFTLSAIAEMPLAYPAIEIFESYVPFRRALLRTFRYAVIFEVLADEILVVAVAHTSRAPDYWLERSKL
ncbi:MAG: type II toxin-antitoxin system RelE/ParE family toxin [Alphaproteobacteria bacterium]|nr:type II toxin-antitoxin system RelE/ParE family toxin [Alphaproteobacteria bacterium]